jgi:hypothetical protein
VGKIEVPEDQVVPIEAIAPGLAGLKITFVNVFGVTHADRSWTLIDAAIPYSASRIKHWADQAFGRSPNAIVLTHGHFDHVSAAAGLADEWNVPIYAHPLEFPYLTGQKEYPPPNWAAGGGVMPLLSPALPRGPSIWADGCAPCPTILCRQLWPSCRDGPSFIPQGIPRGTSASFAKPTAPSSSATHSAQPGQRASFRPTSFSILSCTDRQLISPPTGAPPRLR